VQQQQPINKKSTAKHRSGRKKLKAGQIVGIVFGSFVLLIFLIGIIASGLSSESTIDVGGTTTPTQRASSASDLTSEAKEAGPQKIYDDKFITAWFVKKYDISYMPGMFYFDIKVENKTDKKVTIYPQDSYVNGTTFSAYSGESMNVLPNKDRTHTFFGSYEGTGIKSADDIKEIGFKINVTDESTNEIETTRSIKIKF
jgi:hypothetical protein